MCGLLYILLNFEAEFRTIRAVINGLSERTFGFDRGATKFNHVVSPCFKKATRRDQNNNNKNGDSPKMNS